MSWASRKRPLISGMPSVSWKLGVTRRMSPHGLELPLGAVYPSTLKLLVDQLLVNGMTVVPATAVTPGTARTAGIIRSKKASVAVSFG